MKQQSKIEVSPKSFLGRNLGRFMFIALLCIIAMACQTKAKDNAAANAADRVSQSSDINGENSSGFEIRWGETDLAAIAFIGYYTDTEKAMAEAKRKYGYDARTVEMDGDECYIIIPRKPEAKIEVCPYSYDVVEDKTTVGKPLYSADEAPVLLRCNLSDVHANARIIVTLNGKKAVFEPKLSLQDGTIDLPGITPGDQGTILDITQYTQKIGEPNEQTSVYDCDPMHENKSMALLKNGSVSVSANNGTDDGFHKVEGLEGICKKIFWSNWGQDMNPLLCMLMDDGGVEVLDFNTAMRMGDFTSSGRLLGLENIVSFKHQNSEDGSGAAAIDSDGKAYDIEMFCSIGGEIYHFEKTAQGTMKYSLFLTPDWKIFFTRGLYGNKKSEVSYKGRFRGKAFVNDNVEETYTYLMQKAGKNTKDVFSDGYFEKGSFTLKQVESSGMGVDYKIHVTSGNIRFGADTEESPQYGHSDVDPF